MPWVGTPGGCAEVRNKEFVNVFRAVLLTVEVEKKVKRHSETS